MKKIKVVVDTGFCDAGHIDYEDLPEAWEAYTTKEQERYLEETAQDSLNNYISAYADVIEEDDE